jgi:hypothetical protein
MSFDLAKPKQMPDSTMFTNRMSTSHLYTDVMLTDTIPTHEPDSTVPVFDEPNAEIMQHPYPQQSNSNTAYAPLPHTPSTPEKHAGAQSKNTGRRHKESEAKTMEEIRKYVGGGGAIPVYGKSVPTNQEREKDRLRKQAKKKQQLDADMAAARDMGSRSMYGLP